MTNKRQVKTSIKHLQRVKTWQLLVLLLIAGLISATFLRLNNIAMVERRTAVLQADERGAAEETANNLYALQRHTSTHMNASTGPVYLEGSYDRAVQKAVKAAQQRSSSINQGIYAQADETCKRQFSGYSQAYVQCFAAELAKHPSADLQQDAELPNPELFRHEFTSPFWSPDFAGWSVLVCLFITLVIIARLVSLGILKLLLSRHYDSI